MNQIGRYWAFVAGFAWKEARGEFLKGKRSIVPIVVLIALAGAAVLGPIVIGLDKLVVPASAALLIVVRFVWKLISIPARTHSWQKTADDLRHLARPRVKRTRRRVFLATRIAACLDAESHALLSQRATTR